MDLLSGLLYNLRGLMLGMKTGKLLFWGCIRFLVVILITVLLSGMALAFHNEIMGILWTKPQSIWIIWLWYLVSWLVTLFLLGFSALISYLVSQVLFSVVIMDLMSRITERKIKGVVREPVRMPFWRLFIVLVRQEIPRSILPVLVTLLVMILSWFIALGPVLVPLSSLVAVIFLSWDNTDLTPARRLLPFKQRWRSFMKNLLFHIGFGIPFLVPGLNILFLSFAPVGATLYYLDRFDRPDGEA